MMNSTLSKVIIFTAGAAIGSAVTWKLVKTKYEQIAREEIESVRDLYFSERCEKNYEENEDNNEEDEEDQKTYASIIKDAGYSDHQPEKKEEEETDNMEPYVISPEEFDEVGYETVSLYYYEDGVVTNAITSEVINNPEDYIGEDFVNHFGEYEDDAVYVRNDDIETDFEILRDERRYSEGK